MIVLAGRFGLVAEYALVDADVVVVPQVRLHDVVEIDAGRGPLRKDHRRECCNGRGRQNHRCVGHPELSHHASPLANSPWTTPGTRAGSISAWPAPAPLAASADIAPFGLMTKRRRRTLESTSSNAVSISLKTLTNAILSTKQSPSSTGKHSFVGGICFVLNKANHTQHTVRLLPLPSPVFSSCLAL